MMDRIRKFFTTTSEEGATAVEYGLMVALIAVVIIGAVVALGNNTKDTFQCTADSLSSGADECPTDTSS